MAKGRPSPWQSASQPRTITKAVNPNIAAMARQPNAQGLSAEPTARPFALMEAINVATGGGMPFDPLPRDTFDTGAFGPLNPLVPDPIDALGPDGRSAPRTWQYPVGWNLPGSGSREVPWQVLRQASLGVGIMRRCIEVRKKHVRALKWSFGPTEEAITELYEKDPSKGKLDAERQLRERLMPEIRRLTERWKKPWRGNNVSFGQWGNAVIDNYLTFDAVVVYPQMSYGKEVLDLQLVDPSTIKVLLDTYGNQPQSPHPAYQQELYGFPRGEWAASVTQDDEGNEVISSGFAASELFYYRENYRTDSPYGLSAVEQALYDSRVYLQRQRWMLAEYEDGSTPLTWLETPVLQPGVQGLTLTQARQWMAALNAKTAGNTAERLRAKVLPNGWKAMQMAGVDERYRPEYDLFLIKVMCSYFGVPVTELGFTESAGLGGSSMHEGQADVSGRVGQRPDTAVLGDIVNAVSAQFLRMPKEIGFNFTDPTGVNDAESAQITVGQLGTAQMTTNDAREALGKARFTFPEADMPYVLGGPTGIIFLEGAKAAADAAVEQAKVAAQAQVVGTAGKLELEHKRLDDGKQAREEGRQFAREEREATADTDLAKAAEITAYRNYSRKRDVRGFSRPFVFKHVTPDDLPELLNCPPEVVDFEGGIWVWEEDDLTKAARIKSGLSWLDWNAKHPTRPRDARGRWVKADQIVGEAGSLPTAIGHENARIEAARARQARIDAVRAAAKPVVLSYRNAGSTGLAEDIGKLDAADRDLRAAGGSLFAMPETVHRYDPKLHEIMAEQQFGGRPPVGAPVIVNRPGVRWDEEGIVLDRAVVLPADAGEEDSLRDFWKEQEIDVHTLMKDRELRWRSVGESSTVEPVDIEPTAEQKRFHAMDQQFRTENAQDAVLAKVRQAHDVVNLAQSSGFLARVRHHEDSGGSPYMTVELAHPGTSDSFTLTWHTRGTGTYRLFSKGGKEPFRGRGYASYHDVASIKYVTERIQSANKRAAEAEEAPEVPVQAVAVHLTLPEHTALKRLYRGYSVDAGPVLTELVSRGFVERGSRVITPEGLEALKNLTKAAAPDDPEAGGAGPKEPAPVPPDTRWPGWLLDTVIAGYAASQLLAAMRMLTTGAAISALLNSFLAWARPAGHAEPVRTPEGIRQWLAETRILSGIEMGITPPVRGAHLEGGLVGQESAREVLDWVREHGDISSADSVAVQFSINWGDWTPGHPEAAQLLLDPGGLARLLAQSDITIKQIAANRLDELGRILGQGLSEGLSPRQIARRIEEWGASEGNAYRIALTETNRAQSAAALEQYRQAGMLEKGWMTAHDQRVCKICHNNAYELDGSERVIAIDARFPSGDLHPPGHPHCRCALIPVIRSPGRG